MSGSRKVTYSASCSIVAASVIQSFKIPMKLACSSFDLTNSEKN